MAPVSWTHCVERDLGSERSEPKVPWRPFQSSRCRLRRRLRPSPRTPLESLRGASHGAAPPPACSVQVRPVICDVAILLQLKGFASPDRWSGINDQRPRRSPHDGKVSSTSGSGSRRGSPGTPTSSRTGCATRRTFSPASCRKQRRTAGRRPSSTSSTKRRRDVLAPAMVRGVATSCDGAASRRPATSRDGLRWYAIVRDRAATPRISRDIPRYSAIFRDMLRYAAMVRCAAMDGFSDTLR